MADLTEASVYESAVPSISTSDDVVGSTGAPYTDGIANQPHSKLANRTKYLKALGDSHTASISNLNANVTALQVGKADIANEEVTGFYRFKGSIEKDPSYYAESGAKTEISKTFEFCFNMEDTGTGFPAQTSKNLIQKDLSANIFLKYTELYAITIDGQIIFKNDSNGSYWVSELNQVWLPTSHSDPVPYCLLRPSKQVATLITKSRNFYIPNGSRSASRWGDIEIENGAVTYLDGGTDAEIAPVFFTYRKVTGESELQVGIRNAHTSKITFLVGRIRISTIKNLVT